MEILWNHDKLPTSAMAIEIKKDKEAERYTKRVLKEINKSKLDSYGFQIPRRNHILVVDIGDALAEWVIQPKRNDSAKDLEIIQQHNRKVLTALRERGLEIPPYPGFEGE